MPQKYLITFTENDKRSFDVSMDEESKKCLSQHAIFPAKFVFKNGKEFIFWLSRESDFRQEEFAIVHTLYGSTLWFEVLVKMDGRIVGFMRDISKRVKIWATNSMSTYYYDKYGRMEYVQVFDDETGDNLPESPGICTSCGYEFKLTNQFEEGKCPACADYEKDKKDKPDLSSNEWFENAKVEDDYEIAKKKWVGKKSKRAK